jgi:phosphoglycolate phosphatase-like HAD superfamily hydrolase
LVDVARVTRAAYAEAFPAVTGRPLIKLPQTAGRSESEIFFDALALNAADLNSAGEAERLLEPFSAELAAALRARRDDLARQGQALPGAAEAMAAVGKLDGPGDMTVQTVLTGSSRERASAKYRVAFGEDVTVYVADSPRDVDAARIGGARSLAVASGRASAAELRDAGADAVLPDLTDTPGLTALIARLTRPPA